MCLAAALPKKKTVFNKNAVLCLLSPSSADKAVMPIKPPSLLPIMLYKTEPVAWDTATVSNTAAASNVTSASNAVSTSSTVFAILPGLPF